MGGEALGLLAAAVMAAFVSFLGLVISKEQSVSEFRQQWIDGLGKDTAALIACIWGNRGDSIAGRGGMSEELWKDVKPDLVEFNKLVARIKLRLNPHESRSEEKPATQMVLRVLKET